MATDRECPACRQPGLRLHCGNVDCTWKVCRACDLLYDTEQRRGYLRVGKQYHTFDPSQRDEA